MAEQLIPTITISKALDTTLEIHTFYLGNTFTCCDGDIFTFLPNILLANYYSQDGVIDSLAFNEGELIINGINIPFANDIWINSLGELIVDGADSEGYYIDNDGYLIYDACLDEDSSHYYQCGYIEADYIE